MQADSKHVTIHTTLRNGNVTMCKSATINNNINNTYSNYTKISCNKLGSTLYFLQVVLLEFHLSKIC
jgi:hypothetical protein